MYMDNNDKLKMVFDAYVPTDSMYEFRKLARNIYRNTPAIDLSQCCNDLVSTIKKIIKNKWSSIAVDLYNYNIEIDLSDENSITEKELNRLRSEVKSIIFNFITHESNGSINNNLLPIDNEYYIFDFYRIGNLLKFIL